MIGAHLLTLSAAGLDVHPIAVRLLTLGAHLNMLSPLWSLSRGKPLLMLHPRRGKSAATAMAASAAECLQVLAATATTVTTAAEGLSLLVATATAAALNLGLVAAMAAAVPPRPRVGRGCDR
jgi:hypothetical protein